VPPSGSKVISSAEFKNLQSSKKKKRKKEKRNLTKLSTSTARLKGLYLTIEGRLSIYP
jgi:hypothetical protein